MLSILATKLKFCLAFIGKNTLVFWGKIY